MICINSFQISEAIQVYDIVAISVLSLRAKYGLIVIVLGRVFMEIEMKIRGLMMDPTANTPIVILKDVIGDAMLPIWVGAFEANAIALEIEKLPQQRPMTHDLIKNILVEFGCIVRRIVITDLIKNTFFAMIELLKNGEVVVIDSRPSDAIALALRVDCPIYVSDTVLNSSTSTIIEDIGQEDDDWPDDLIDDASDYKM